MEQSIVVSAEHSGGTHTSRTMMLAELTRLLACVPAHSRADEYRAAVIDSNCLGKATLSGRHRSHRYLRELYALDPARLGFRALRDLWDKDVEAQPILALLSALARDRGLRATADVILDKHEGAPVDSQMCSRALLARYPGSYSDAVAAKVGRNTASTWTQSGHVVGRTNKTRTRANSAPSAIAYALLIGHTEGRRGMSLFDTLWCRVLDRPRDVLLELARRASQRGLLELKHGGGVTEVGFRTLLRPFEGEGGE